LTSLCFYNTILNIYYDFIINKELEMQELIKIEKRVIGAEETNSVNGRDLHQALEIKKQYSEWIKSQISRAGLRKDVDY